MTERNEKIFGYDWSDIQRAQQRGRLHKPVPARHGDYGADPIGGGKFRMVPSGDVVDFEERCRRLRPADYAGAVDNREAR